MTCSSSWLGPASAVWTRRAARPLLNLHASTTRHYPLDHTSCVGVPGRTEYGYPQRMAPLWPRRTHNAVDTRKASEADAASTAPPRGPILCSAASPTRMHSPPLLLHPSWTAGLRCCAAAAAHALHLGGQRMLAVERSGLLAQRLPTLAASSSTEPASDIKTHRLHTGLVQGQWLTVSKRAKSNPQDGNEAALASAEDLLRVPACQSVGAGGVRVQPADSRKIRPRGSTT